MDLEQEYQEALEARRMALAAEAERYDDARAAFDSAMDEHRAAEKAFEAYVKAERDRIDGLRDTAMVLHRAVESAHRARLAAVGEYVDRDLISRRDKLRAELSKLRKLRRDHLAHVGRFEQAIRQGEIRSVKAPVPPRLKKGEEAQFPAHKQIPNPKRFQGEGAKSLLEQRRDFFALQAEEVNAQIYALEPKLRKAEAELDHAVAEALKRG